MALKLVRILSENPELASRVAADISLVFQHPVLFCDTPDTFGHGRWHG